MKTKIARWFFLGIIYLRVLADAIGMLLPDAVERAIKMGWPVNQFWIDSNYPGVLILLVLAIYLAFHKSTGPMTIIASIQTIGWIRAFLVYEKLTPEMKMDAHAWAVVTVAFVAILIIDTVTERNHPEKI